MNTKFDLMTVVEKNEGGYTFLEVDSLVQLEEEFEMDPKEAYVIFDKRSNVTYEELDTLSGEEGYWFVSQITDEGTHVGHEFESFSEMMSRLDGLIEEAMDSSPDYVLVYPPHAKTIG